jgi:hypothetical protein
MEKTKSRQQNSGQNRNINVANRPFKNVAKLKCFGTTVTHQNLIRVEIKRRLNSGLRFLPFSAETFIFSSDVYKHKNYNVQNYKFVCSFLDLKLGL